MTDTRKVVTSIIASVVVVGVVVGLVLTFAFIPLPDFPHLADNPDSQIQGRVAFAGWEDGDLCVSVVEASGGEPTEVLCDGNIGFGEFSPGWTPDGLLIIEEFGPRGEDFRLVDPTTGETVDRIAFQLDEGGPAGRDFAVYEDGLNVFIEEDRDAAQIILEDAEGNERIALEAEGPADYRFDWARLSPDRRWALIQDSEGRLIVIATEGDPNARILAEDVDGWMAAAWFIEGYEEGTWDPRTASA
jgi:hypothetical protein